MTSESGEREVAVVGNQSNSGKFVSFTNFFQYSTSDLTSEVNFSGFEPERGIAPMRLICSLKTGSVAALASASVILATTGAGILAGPTTPNHGEMSMGLAPAWVMVGTLGSSSPGSSEITARARILPVFTN